MVNTRNGSADIVHAVAVKQFPHIGGGLSEMSVYSVEFQGAVNKIVSAASDITDAVHILVIFKKPH